MRSEHVLLSFCPSARFVGVPSRRGLHACLCRQRTGHAEPGRMPSGLCGLGAGSAAQCSRRRAICRRVRASRRPPPRSKPPFRNKGCPAHRNIENLSISRQVDNDERITVAAMMLVRGSRRIAAACVAAAGAASLAHRSPAAASGRETCPWCIPSTAEFIKGGAQGVSALRPGTEPFSHVSWALRHSAPTAVASSDVQPTLWSTVQGVVRECHTCRGSARRWGAHGTGDKHG